METHSPKTRALNFLRAANKIPLIENFLVASSIKGNRIAKKVIGANTLYAPGTIRTCARNGINYRLDISDYLDHGIYFSIEEGIDLDRQTLYNLVKPNQTIIDAGANIGDTALHFASLLNHTGKVFAFEPVPYLFARLQTNYSLNNFKNIELVNLALSDKKEELSFSKNTSGNSGGTFLSHEKNSDMVYAVTIDAFVKEKNIAAIGLIKIDVEGFEMNVLKGAAQTLTQFRPKLFIEVNDRFLMRQQSSAKELISFLIEKKYTLLRADTNEKLSAAYDFMGKHFDVIGVPE